MVSQIIDQELKELISIPVPTLFPSSYIKVTILVLLSCCYFFLKTISNPYIFIPLILT